MLLVLTCFFFGVLTGIVLRNKPWLLGAASRLSDWLVCFLLFVLGVTIGVKSEVFENLASLGLESLLLTLGTILGSILAVFPVYVLIFRDRYEK